jgi:hypothetical protein
MQICDMFTNRVVRAGEEFLWSYPPSFCGGKYVNQIAPCQSSKVVDEDASTPSAKNTAQKPKQVSKPPPKPKAAAKHKQPPVVQHSQPAYVRGENPYGAPVAHDDREDQNNDDSDNVPSSDAGSGSSPESSDNGEDYINQPQPVYREFQFPILDTKRKIRFDWEVKNEVASNVAPSLYMGTTKLHWKTIGLAGLTRTKTELECFMLMDVPISTPTVHGTSILSMTNDSIRAAKSKRGGDITKSVNLIHHHHH